MQYSEAKIIFLERGRSFFLFIAFIFQSCYMESIRTAVYIWLDKCTYAGGKYLPKIFSGWDTDGNIIKISPYSRLFFLLHLLANGVIVKAMARRAIEPILIVIQLFPHERSDLSLTWEVIFLSSDTWENSKGDPDKK